MKPTKRCSSLDRDLLCPGAPTLAAMVNHRDGNESKEGTAIHAAVAASLARDHGAVNYGDTAPDLSSIPKPSRWIVDYCVREVLNTVDSSWSLECEQSFAYDLGNFILSGHIDALAISPDGTEAIGFDYKTGYTPVDPADENWQCAGYAMLLKTAYPDLEKITFEIVQPRNDEASGFERVSTVVVEGATLANLGATLIAAIENSMRRSDELETGLRQCRWCPAAVQCPALAAEIESMKLKLTPEMLAKIEREPRDGLLAELVISAKTLAPVFEQAEKMLHDRLDVNAEIVADGGLRVSRKVSGGSYTCVDPLAVFTELNKMLTPEQVAPALSYPTGKIKDALADGLNIPKSGKKSPITAESVFSAKLLSYYTQGERRTLLFL